MQADTPGGATGGPGPAEASQVVLPGLPLSELQCPICVDLIQDPFVTPCGHTFCYGCITTHLKHQSNCPCCRSYLVQEAVHPNFLLGKILQRAAGATPAAAPASPAAALMSLLQGVLAGDTRLRGADIDNAIQVLQSHRRQLTHQEHSSNLQLLLLFLEQARSNKAAALGELQSQLAVLAADVRTALLGHISDPAALPSLAGAAVAGLPPALQAAAGGAGQAAAAAGGGAGSMAATGAVETAAAEQHLGGTIPSALQQQLKQFAQPLQPGQAAAAAATSAEPSLPSGAAAAAAVEPGPREGAGVAGTRRLHPSGSALALMALATAGEAPTPARSGALPGATQQHPQQHSQQQLQQQPQSQAADSCRAPGGPSTAVTTPGLAPALADAQMQLLAQLQQRRQQTAAAAGEPASVQHPPTAPAAAAGSVRPAAWPSGGVGGTGEPQAAAAAAGVGVGGGFPFRPGPRLGPGLGSSSSGFQPYLAASTAPPAAVAAGGGAAGCAVPVGVGPSGWVAAAPGSPVPGSPGEEDAADRCSVAPPRNQEAGRAAAAVQAAAVQAAPPALPPPAAPTAAAPTAAAAARCHSVPGQALLLEEQRGSTPEGGSAGAALPPSRKRKILSQFPALVEAYLASRLATGAPGEPQPTPPTQQALLIAAAAGGSAGAGVQVHRPAAAAAAAAAARLPDLDRASAAAGGVGRAGQGQGQGLGGARGPSPSNSSSSSSGVRGGPLAAFSHMLSSVTRYSGLQLLGRVTPAGPAAGRGGSGQVLSAAEWNCSGDLFAVTGPSGRICAYSYADVVRGAAAPGEAPSPACQVELVARCKLSCLSFSPAVRSRLLSGDGEGGVAGWDLEVGRCLGRWEAGGRRIHALHHCPLEPGRWATASDDGSVKVWSDSSPSPLLALPLGVPVCSVRCHPSSPHLLAVGSAAHQVLLYDLRAPGAALAVLAGHRKTVSYVRWQPNWEAGAAGGGEGGGEGADAPAQPEPADTEGAPAGGGAGDAGPALVTAAVDSTVRRWVYDPQGAAGAGAAAAAAGGWRCAQVYSGHTATRVFTGLSCQGPYIATGSETNEVVVYHSAVATPAITRPLTLWEGSFGATPARTGGPRGVAAGWAGAAGEAPPGMVSAVAWRPNSRVLLAANSQGGIWCLGLTA